MEKIKSKLKKKLLDFWIARLSVVELRLLELEKTLKRAPFFVQVGANDGVTTDPFSRVTERWDGLLIEPQPESFALLSAKRTRAGHVACLNVAVAEERSELPLFTLNAPHGRWSSGLASMHRSVLEHHIAKGYVEGLARKHGFKLPADRSEWIVETKVPVRPLADLLLEQGIMEVNALLVDTEGHDFAVLKSFPWDRMRPQLVIYEECHLGVLADGCRDFLRSQGYALQSQGMNVVASADTCLSLSS